VFADERKHPYLWSWARPRSDGLWLSADLEPHYLDELEWLFRTIELDAPRGWEKKRTAFQTDVSDEGLKGQYLELILAAKLIHGGLSLEFPDRPDIVVNGVLGIEAWAINPDFRDPVLENGELDIYRLQRHLCTIEKKIRLTATKSKAHQAKDIPTMLAVGVAHAGTAWLRPPEVWASQLETMKNQIGDFAGVMVVVATYGAPYIHAAAAIGNERMPVNEYQAVCSALVPSPPST